MILPGFPKPMVVNKAGGLKGAKWNPADTGGNITLSNGNLTAKRTTGSGFGSTGVRADRSLNSGKYYWEINTNRTDFNSQLVGIAQSTASLTGTIGATSDGRGYDSSGNLWTGSGAVSGSGWSGATDIIGIAINFDAMRVFFRYNGVWQLSGNPSAGTGGMTISSGDWFPVVCFTADNSTNFMTANFDGPFAYSVPTGFN